MKTELYTRNFNKDVIYWSIEDLDNNTAKIQHGVFNGKYIEVTIKHSDIHKEIKSRVARKRKEGYQLLNIPNVPDLTLFFNTVLPFIKYDDNWNTKPMKCQPFREKKMVYPAYAQPKLNGLRCTLRWEKVIEGEGLFQQTVSRAVLRTKEGLEYVLPHITSVLNEDHFKYNDLSLAFDGELYIRGKPLNYIKAACPIKNSFGTVSKSSNFPMDVKFHIFDLAIENKLQFERIDILNNLNSFNRKQNNLSIYNEHIRLVESIFVQNDAEVFNFRNNCITAGYEGCVIRSLHEEYAFGHRPSFIMKFKTHIDSEFKIVDIIPQKADPNKGQFILQNDINSETFESMPSGKEFGTHDAQEELLLNKQDYIGKYATVRYRERSGVKLVPFHQNVIGIRVSPSSDLLID